MILFYEDWEMYPEAFPDTSTRNTSFIRYSGLLKKMGVRNHAFCLALHNKLLLGVDPYSPTLTYEQKLMIIEEVSVNPWYFFREVVRVPSKGSVDPVFFRANRGNISMFWLFFNEVMTYLIQIRQTGKSLSTDMLFRGLLNYWTVNTNMLIVTKDSVLRAENTDRLKDIESTLPPFMRMVTKSDSNNTEGITVNSLGNSLKILLAQKSKIAAANLGRGLTSSIIGVDELAFLYNNKISIPALLAGGNAARDTAKKNGLPSGTLFYTTAGYLDTPAGEYAYSIYEKAARWTESLYDAKDNKELKDIVSNHSRGEFDIVLLEFNHKQLGYTDEWLRTKIRESGLTGPKLEAELMNKWSKGSVTSALGPKLIKLISNSIEEPKYTEISPQGFMLRWYVDKNTVESYKKRSFVFGLDMSEGIGRDDIAFYGRDIMTGETIVTGKYNKLNLNDFGEFIFWFLRTYEKSVFIPENKSTAVTLLDQLETLFGTIGESMFKRIFNWVVQDLEKLDNNEIKSIKSNNSLFLKNKTQFGYKTAGAGRASRDNLFGSTLIESVEMVGNKIRDKDLVNQLVRLELKNNRIDHKPDDHDDLVIASMLTWWFLKNGKNLDFYGINSQIVLSAVSYADEVVDNINRRTNAERIEKIVGEIDDVLDEIAGESNRVKILKLTIKLNLLKSKLDRQTVKTLNIEARLKEIVEKEGSSTGQNNFNGYIRGRFAA